MRKLSGVLVVFFVACASPPPVTMVDAGRTIADASGACVSDVECDDAIFCNGVERCRGGVCESGSPPCPATMCNGAARRCEGCVDADGDGVCAEADCDDADVRRFPGNDEVCDPGDVDEDCDPRTFGFRDGDGDGAGDALCCNVDGSSRRCGGDCDDGNAVVHPGEAESCNDQDDDCDGMTDEGATVRAWTDMDGDGYGDPASPRDVCPGMGGVAPNDRDCDDTQPLARPGQPEVCDGIDNDCDATTLDAAACTCVVGTSPPRLCGYEPATCAAVTRACAAPGVYDCPGGLRSGREPEICNGDDDDCDGSVDEGIAPPGGTTSCYEGPAGTAGVGICRAGTYRCEGPAGWVCRGAVAPMTGPQCGVDTDCDGDPYEGVDCESPGAPVDCGVECQPPGRRACSSACGWAGECVPRTEYWAWSGSDPGYGHGCGGSAFGAYWQVRPTGICHVQYGNYRTDFVPGRRYRVRFEIGVLDGPVMVDPAVNLVMGSTVTDIAPCVLTRVDPDPSRAQYLTCEFVAPAACAPIELLLAMYPVSGHPLPLVFIRQTEVRGPTVP